MPRLLLIDDEPRVGDALRFALERHGFDVDQAVDAHDGLEQARRRPPEVILLDVDLRGESGLDVCRALKADARTASVPVILLSGLVDPASTARGLEAGGDDYVGKPFTGTALLARIQAQLRSAV